MHPFAFTLMCYCQTLFRFLSRQSVGIKDLTRGGLSLAMSARMTPGID
jgi:hypothetical protein